MPSCSSLTVASVAAAGVSTVLFSAGFSSSLEEESLSLPLLELSSLAAFFFGATSSEESLSEPLLELSFLATAFCLGAGLASEESLSELLDELELSFLVTFFFGAGLASELESESESLDEEESFFTGILLSDEPFLTFLPLWLLALEAFETFEEARARLAGTLTGSELELSLSLLLSESESDEDSTFFFFAAFLAASSAAFFSASFLAALASSLDDFLSVF